MVNGGSKQFRAVRGPWRKVAARETSAARNAVRISAGRLDAPRRAPVCHRRDPGSVPGGKSRGGTSSQLLSSPGPVLPPAALRHTLRPKLGAASALGRHFHFVSSLSIILIAF
jgi:hypothetical protein